MGCSVVVLTTKEITLAKKFLKNHSPLTGGWQGALMRRYLRYKKSLQVKQPFIPINDTGFKSF